MGTSKIARRAQPDHQGPLSGFAVGAPVGELVDPKEGGDQYPGLIVLFRWLTGGGTQRNAASGSIRK